MKRYFKETIALAILALFGLIIPHFGFAANPRIRPIKKAVILHTVAKSKRQIAIASKFASAQNTQLRVRTTIHSKPNAGTIQHGKKNEKSIPAPSTLRTVAKDKHEVATACKSTPAQNTQLKARNTIHNKPNTSTIRPGKKKAKDVPASPYYQQMFRRALKDFGVKDADTFPIYKMRKNELFHSAVYAKAINLDWLAKGIWVNEELLGKKSANLTEYTAYHEAAHIALDHFKDYKQTICKNIAMLGSCVAGLHYILPRFGNGGLLHKIGNLIRFGGILYSSFHLSPVMNFFARYFSTHEQEADYAAVKVLARLGKHDVIATGIKATPYGGKALLQKYKALMAKKQRNKAPRINA